MFRLTTEQIFDLPAYWHPLTWIWPEMKTKVQNMPWKSIFERTINRRKIWNVPLDVLMCPPQISIQWHWTPIIDPSWCKWNLYPPPIQCRKNYASELYFYTSLQIFDSKFKISIATEVHKLFRHLGNQHLTAHQMTQQSYGQKSKIG